jgi:hypothetical protein
LDGEAKRRVLEENKSKQKREFQMDIYTSNEVKFAVRRDLMGGHARAVMTLNSTFLFFGST